MNVRETPRAVTRTVEWEFAQSRYASVLADITAALFPYWAQSAHEEFPGIPRDASFYAQSAEGLMMFFDCVAAAERPCALPSRAADSVWHAWTRMNAADLDRFCILHFGRTIPHLDQAGMKGSMDEALAACLVQGRRRASKPAAGTDLPRLFTLDQRLGMPRGFAYGIVGGLVACSSMDELGQADGRPRFPNALAPQGLLRAGLISPAEYARVRGPVAAPTHATWIAVGSGCGGGGCGGS